MGVSVEGGKGRGKSMNADLNLVPFIDFLSCLLAFLMITAVWSEIAALDQEQAVSSNAPPVETTEQPPPMLVVHVSKDKVRATRDEKSTENPPLQVAKPLRETRKKDDKSEPEHITKLREFLEKDRAAFVVGKEGTQKGDTITIYTEDGVPYADMMEVLDLSRVVGCDKKQFAEAPKSCGYQKTAMAGGAPAAAVPVPVPGGG